MKTTIKEFIAPYIETITTPCLIGSITSSSAKYSIVHKIGLIETNDIEFDENGCVDFSLGREISRLTETEAWIPWCGDLNDVELTDQHSIYIEPCNSEEAFVLDLKTMRVNKYKQQR
jgi:hypothetical protein